MSSSDSENSQNTYRSKYTRSQRRTNSLRGNSQEQHHRAPSAADLWSNSAVEEHPNVPILPLDQT